jgi:hypothetical protein
MHYESRMHRHCSLIRQMMHDVTTAMHVLPTVLTLLVPGHLNSLASSLEY